MLEGPVSRSPLRCARPHSLEEPMHSRLAAWRREVVTEVYVELVLHRTPRIYMSACVCAPGGSVGV